ncbi:MAG: hypothetical protein CVU39_28490 [Chloroflexi bacterium HGW-Chloroflexi-10]|nr:MAG: hypothetical protein CVU39_28490 [Chloroflexi bacterium HGW-Chloroflexi-10]
MKIQNILSLLLFVALLTGCDHPVTTPPSNELPPPAPPTSTPVPPPTPTVEIRSQNLIKWADLSTGKGPVYSQAWSADGKILVTADYDQIRIWDAVTFREAGVLEGHTDFVWGLAWSPTSNPMILASASQDGSVRLWNIATFTQTDLLETGWAYCLAWSPDGRQLAVGNDAGDVQLWDVATREILETWSSDVNDARDDIISIAWSPDGQTVAFGDLAGNINLWDVATGQSRMVLTEQTTDHARDVNGLTWSPDSALLASTHPDGQVQIWDTATGHLAQVIAAHTGWARGIAFSPDGRLLASTGEDKRICLWDWATGQEYAEQHLNRLPVWSVTWSPDSEYVVSGGGGYEQPHVGETIIWKVLTKPSPTELPTEAPNVADGNVIEPENLQSLVRLYTLGGYAIAFHPQEPVIATGELTGYVKIWSLLDGSLLHDLVDLHGMIFDLTFSPDGSLLAAVFGANAVIINAENGENLASIGNLGQFIQAVAFSPDGTLLAVGGSNAIKVLRTADWQEVANLNGHEGSVFDLGFTPDGGNLVSAGGIPDSLVIIWDIENFEIRNTLEGHRGDVHSLAISSDSRFVVTGGSDSTVILWDLSTGELLRRLSGYQDVVYGLAYSPTGNLIAAGCGADGYVMLWDNENQIAPFKLRDEGVEIRLVAFSPDGYYLAESNSNHQIIVWTISQD